MKVVNLSQAAAKYGIPLATLSSYVGAGLIRVYQRPERRGQQLLLFEADVAAIAEHWSPGGGRAKVEKLRKAILAASH